MKKQLVEHTYGDRCCALAALKQNSNTWRLQVIIQMWAPNCHYSKDPRFATSLGQFKKSCIDSNLNGKKCTSGKNAISCWLRVASDGVAPPLTRSINQFFSVYS